MQLNQETKPNHTHTYMYANKYVLKYVYQYKEK